MLNVRSLDAGTGHECSNQMGPGAYIVQETKNAVSGVANVADDVAGDVKVCQWARSFSACHACVSPASIVSKEVEASTRGKSSRSDRDTRSGSTRRHLFSLAARCRQQYALVQANAEPAAEQASAKVQAGAKAAGQETRRLADEGSKQASKLSCVRFTEHLVSPRVPVAQNFASSS